MNVLFDYMYRDHGNWKMGGESVFANPDGLALADTEARLRRACCEDSNFNARQAGVPEVYFETTDIESDQIYHEFCALTSTQQPVTDTRTLRQFVEQFEAAGQQGWEILPRLDSLGYPLPVGRRSLDEPAPAQHSTEPQRGPAAKSKSATSVRSPTRASAATKSQAKASPRKQKPL